MQDYPEAPGGSAPHVFVSDIEMPVLTVEDRHHLARVRRVRAGDLLSVTDGAGGVTRYYYDLLGNPIWVQDASGRWFGSQYDSMGQVTHRYSFQSRFTDAAGTLQSVALLPTTLAQAQAAVASAASPYRAALRDEVTRYDLFNNKRNKQLKHKRLLE